MDVPQYASGFATGLAARIPPRSRLYHLAPAAASSGFAESLTSYIARLAEAHSLQTGILLSKEVAPASKDSWALRSSSRGLDNIYKGSAALNGIGQCADAMIEVLEKLTLQKHLTFLTMNTWRDVLPSRGLVRRGRAWCPICYQEWRAANEVVYDPLLWALEAVSSCPIHDRLLETACPFCGQPQRHLDASYRPGFCSTCGQWLGSDLTQTAHHLQAPSRARWVSTQVAPIIALAGTLEKRPTRGNVARSLAHFAGAASEGDSAAFARIIAVPKNTLWLWLRGTVLPQLGSLLAVCELLQVPVSAVLLGDQHKAPHIGTL